MTKQLDLPLFTDGLEQPDYIRHSDQYPTPSVPPTGEPYRCYRIANDYMPALIGLCEYYTQPDQHSGTLEQREWAAQMFVQLQLILMTGNLECDPAMAALMFRQSPLDPCVLEVSYNSGVTWGTMFDYGLCFAQHPSGSATATATANANAQAYISVKVGEYTGDLGDIAPGMVHDETGQDDYRDLAACVAIGDLIQIVAAWALSSHDLLQGAGKTLAKWILQANIYLIDIISWLDSELNPFGNPIETWLYGLIKENFQDQLDDLNANDLAALKDQAILNTIQCYALDQLDGEDLTYVKFQTLFSGISGLPGISNEIEDWFERATSYQDFYIAMLSTLDELPDKLASGEVDYTCPCAEWSHDITAILQENEDPMLVSVSHLGAVWDGVKWNHLDAYQNQPADYWWRAISLRLDFPTCRITRVEIEDYDLYVDDRASSYIWLSDEWDSSPHFYNKEATGDHIGHTTPVVDYLTNFIGLLQICSQDSGGDDLDGLIRMYKVVVYGRGYDPIQGML